MPKYVPIITEIGTLRGRDAIHLDTVRLSENQNTLTLWGDFNCTLASKAPKDRWQAYRIRFCGMLAMRMTELETWSPLREEGCPKTAFDEVVDSPWLKRARMGYNTTPEHRHFIFRTYDHIFEIICTRFELKLDKIRA